MKYVDYDRDTDTSDSGYFFTITEKVSTIPNKVNAVILLEGNQV